MEWASGADDTIITSRSSADRSGESAVLDSSRPMVASAIASAAAAPARGHLSRVRRSPPRARPVLNRRGEDGGKHGQHSWADRGDDARHDADDGEGEHARCLARPAPRMGSLGFAVRDPVQPLQDAFFEQVGGVGVVIRARRIGKHVAPARISVHVVVRSLCQE